MIPTIVSLAFSMHGNRGLYALMLGPELSHAAGVPSGEEITLNLIERVAALEGAQTGGDALRWLVDEKQEMPDAGRLLERLARTAAERRELLKAYFEPDEEEREAGLKLPTPAHHAVARLVAGGYVRVVLSTGLDRLVESALRAQGVEPTVISSPETLAGAPPPGQADCLVIKLNGDYADAGVTLARGEQAGYVRGFEDLIDRILDEYALLIAGWSAEDNPALRMAIERSQSRRYPSYWAIAGRPTAAAAGLMRLRQAQLLTTESLDSFFGELALKVDTLAEFGPPHPLTTGLAVGLLKRFAADTKHRIRLHDLVMREASRTAERLSGRDFTPPAGASPQDMFRRMRAYESASEVMRRLMAHGCYWNEGRFNALWSDALRFVSTAAGAPLGGRAEWSEIRYYPAVLLFYAAGIGAAAAGDYSLFRNLAVNTRLVEGRESVSVAQLLPAGMSVVAGAFDRLPGYEDSIAPLSEHLAAILADEFAEIIPDRQMFEATFDRFEIMLALIYLDQSYASLNSSYLWMPAGRHLRTDGDDVAERLFEEAKEAGAGWGPLIGGLFGGSQERLGKLRSAFFSVRAELRSRRP